MRPNPIALQRSIMGREITPNIQPTPNSTRKMHNAAVARKAVRTKLTGVLSGRITTSDLAILGWKKEFRACARSLMG
jgi:hypothetical protein